MQPKAMARIELFLVGILAVLALVVAACGGGNDDDDAGADQPTQQATAAPTDGDDGNGDAEPTDGAFEEVQPVNQTFWHQGFMIEIGDAIYAGTEPDFFGEQEFSFTLEATFTNEGPDTSFLDSSVTLVTPDETYTALFGSIPSVPGGGLSADGVFQFRVGEGFEFDGAYLVVGGGDVQRARVPIGPGSGELVSLEPVEMPMMDTLSTSLIDLDFTSLELRADYPSSHFQVDAEKLALTLHFDATSRRSGNWSVFATEFALTLPGGTTVGADSANLPGLPGADAGLTTQDLDLRFLVDDPPEGTYTLTFTPSDRWYAEGEPTELTLEFELEEFDSAGSQPI